MRVKIDKLGMNGEGVARIPKDDNGQKVCFIEGALPNEVVDISVGEEKSRYLIGKLDKVVINSDDRQIPRCKYFSICGGCDTQHMSFELECDYKGHMIEETINKIAKINTTISEFISSNEYSYRNKMVFPVVNVGNNGIVGMFKNNTHDIIEIDNCCICKNEINTAMQIIKSWLNINSFIGYDFKNNTGDIMYIVLRYHSNQLLCTLVLNKDIVAFDSLYSMLNNQFKSVGLSKIISNHKADILNGKYTLLYGIDKININEFGIRYSIDNRGFLQINNDIKEKLYTSVLNEIDKDSNVIDAYSGAGLMSAIIAKKCKSVLAIEINKSASNSAKNLFESNNIVNAKSICADVSLTLGNSIKKLDNVTVVLDPPRSGCEKSILEKLNYYANAGRVKKIIYVSCNPATLARDLSILKESYIIDSVRVYNMFPKTKHIETLVCLQRRV